MNRSEHLARKDEIARTFGPRTAHTLHLGHGIYTDQDPVCLAGNAGSPLNRLRGADFVRNDDIRNLHPRLYGTFDVVLCPGVR